MKDQYEFFDRGSCDTTLPANAVVEEHTFGQFVTLAINLKGTQFPINILESPTAVSSVHERMRFMEYGVSLSAVVNNIIPDLVSSPIVTIDDDSLNRMLAYGELTIDGQKTQVQLNSTMVSTLLSGQSMSVTARTESGSFLVQVVPPIAKAQAPAVTRYEIQDIGAFVIDPNIPGIDDLPFDIKLSPKLVDELRKVGSAEIKVGSGQSVELVVNPLANENNVQRMKKSLIASFQDDTRVKMKRNGMDDTSLYTSRWTGPHVALFLPWKQRWELLGYSRGILLHSLSLAPQEETTIELFTWDRRKRSLEQESDTETDQSFERNDITKDTTDVINELTNSGEFQVQADARVKVTYPVIQAEIGGQLSNKDSVTKISKRTAQHLAESTTKAATRVKTRRTTKITETMEVGREERVTRKVRNPNMCHTLNLDYFEVVANYRVATQFAEEDAAICVLIDMPSEISGIRFDDPRNCRIHEKALGGALLDRSLAAGFEAARLLASREYAKNLVCDKVRCASEPTPKPASSKASMQQGITVQQVSVDVTNAFNEVTRATKSLINSKYKLLLNFWRDHATAEPPANIILDFRRWLYWTLLIRLIPHLGDVLIAAQDKDDGSTDVSTMENVFRAIPSAGELMQPNSLLDEQQVKTDFDNIVWKALDGYHNEWRWGIWWWDTLRSHGALYPNDDGLISALKTFQRLYGSWQRSQPQQMQVEEVVSEAQQQQQVDTDNDRLEYAYSLRELADAQERLDALIGHLKLHASYYHYAILQAMPLGDQMQLLTGADAPIQLCEPRVIGMIQGTRGTPDRIAVPLNLELLEQGISSSDSQAMHKLKGFVDEILAELRSTDGGSRDVNLPTSGVMLESRLGQCDACEDFIAQSRTVELEQRREQVRALRATTTLQDMEARRYEARLNTDPPQLDDPKDTVGGVGIRLDPVRVIVEQPTPPK